MKHLNSFQCYGVSESCEVAQGPNPPGTNRVKLMREKWTTKKILVKIRAYKRAQEAKRCLYAQCTQEAYG